MPIYFIKTHPKKLTQKLTETNNPNKKGQMPIFIYKPTISSKEILERKIGSMVREQGSRQFQEHLRDKSSLEPMSKTRCKLP
jgi:hypothetical protein